MHKNFNRDRLTLVKADGQVAKENFPALVVGNKVFTADQFLPLEVGDHLLRMLPNGLVEDYEIIEPRFFNVGTDSHFQIDVRRAGSPTEKATIIQGITNHFTGSNSRVNINSTDNSINASTDFSPRKLHAFIEQVRPVISQLPENDREVVDAELASIEREANKSKPSRMSVLASLQSIRAVAEGASGNLVAAGILSLIGSLL